MPWLRRLHPLDVVAAAVALTVLGFALVSVRGYRFRGSVETGLMRSLPVVLTLVIADPTVGRLALEHGDGAFAAETSSGPSRLELSSVERDPDEGSVRLRVAVPAEVDGSGRAFWNGIRLRRGERFHFGDAGIHLGGVISEVKGLGAASH